MARFHNEIGFVEEGEVEPGIHSDSIVIRRSYFGDIRQDRRQPTPSLESGNDNLILSNIISIVADSYMIHHLDAIKFVMFNGICWKVTRIEIVQPRVNLTLGGVWNGPKA